MRRREGEAAMTETSGTRGRPHPSRAPGGAHRPACGRCREAPAGRDRLRFVGVVARCTLHEARRSRLPEMMALFLGGTLVVAGLAEEVALTEALATRNGLHAAMLRTGAVLALTLFVVASAVRDRSEGFLALLLAQPGTRADYYCGKLFAGMALAGGIAILCGLCLLPHAPLRPVLLWTATLTLELGVIVSASLLGGLAFRHTAPALLAVLAFYLLARSIDALLLLSRTPLGTAAQWWRAVEETVVAIVYHLVPDLGRYASSEWLVYPPPAVGELPVLATRAAFGVALLSALTLFDLYRRDL